MSADEATIAQMMADVIDVAEGRVTGVAATAVLDRIAADPAWAAVHLWVTQFLADTKDLVLVEVPASTRAMLDQLVPARPTLGERARETARAAARLVRDVRPGTAFAGARSSAATRRQLLFALADGSELALELEARGTELVVTGQLLGGALEYTAELTGDHGRVTATADEVGEFRIVVAAPTFLRLDIAATDGRTTIDLTTFLDDHEQGATR